MPRVHSGDVVSRALASAAVTFGSCWVSPGVGSSFSSGGVLLSSSSAPTSTSFDRGKKVGGGLDGRGGGSASLNLSTGPGCSFTLGLKVSGGAGVPLGPVAKGDAGPGLWRKQHVSLGNTFAVVSLLSGWSCEEPRCCYTVSFLI